MAQMVIAGKVVTGPDQFKQLISGLKKRKPVMVTRWLSTATVAAKLERYAATWRKEMPLINDQQVFFRQVLVDLCDMLDLDEADALLIIGKDMELPGLEMEK